MQIQEIHLPFDVPLLPYKELSAGNLTCLYEHGTLRYIRVNGQEVIQMIYSAVRDERWQTAPYTITDEVIEETENGFTISYNATYRLAAVEYKAAIAIEGKSNSIIYSMNGTAIQEFNTNRIGLCVLHPIAACKGRQVVITQPDGTTYRSSFPERISPHQPFKQVQQMDWTTATGLRATLIFEGDVFETEDQRNWTDASYKTYSRPLELPFPYEVQKGERIVQSVTLNIISTKSKGGTNTSQNASVETKMLFPAIGYSRPKGSKQLTADEIELLRELPFDHYRIELHLNDADWQLELANAVSEAKALATKLELVVFFGVDIENELKEVIRELTPVINFVKNILPLHYQQNITPHMLFARMYEVLKAGLPEVMIGYGTDRFFAEVNRNRPEDFSYDFVSYSLNPQVHAVDTRSIIENLAAHPDTIATVQSFTGNKPVHVSPVTLKIRGNADPVLEIDNRLHTSFGAWWTLQTIKNLGEASSITLYETKGAKGIILANCSRDLLPPLYSALVAIKTFKPVYIINKNAEGNNTFVAENKDGNQLIFVSDLMPPP